METLTSLLTAIPITIGGTFITWMGWRGGQGKLERNTLMGVRNPTTLQSDAAWEAAHRAVAKPTMIGGIGATISGVIAAFIPIETGYIVVLVGGRLDPRLGRGQPGHRHTRGRKGCRRRGLEHAREPPREPSNGDRGHLR